MGQDDNEFFEECGRGCRRGPQVWSGCGGAEGRRDNFRTGLLRDEATVRVRDETPGVSINESIGSPVLHL